MADKDHDNATTDTDDFLRELEEATPDEGEEEELAAAEQFVEEQVQRSIAPYRATFSPEVLEEMEDDLRCFLLTHPVCHDMLTRIRPFKRTVSGSNGAETDRPATSKGKKTG
jgi:hypothetical protein